MKTLRLWMIGLLVGCCSAAGAQSAKSVLDKTAQALASKGGVTASFKARDAQNGSVSGTISIKGRKFYAKTTAATVWFDGKTQWTYVPQNDEVNISTPTASELSAINPYGFVYLYRQGYTLSMQTQGQSYVVTMKSQKKAIREMVVTVLRQSYVPTQVRLLQNNRWTTVTISDFKRGNLSDGLFQFNRKACPHAEIIDLR